MKKWNVIVSIIAITTIEIVALLNGIDGVALASGLACIAGLGGYSINALRRHQGTASHHPHPVRGIYGYAIPPPGTPLRP